MSYTPGPWTFYEGRIFSEYNENIAQIFTDDLNPATAEENGHLISAAPDLLDALKGLMMEAETYCSGETEAWDTARAAIRKARGGP